MNEKCYVKNIRKSIMNYSYLALIFIVAFPIKGMEGERPGPSHNSSIRCNYENIQGFCAQSLKEVTLETIDDHFFALKQRISSSRNVGETTSQAVDFLYIKVASIVDPITLFHLSWEEKHEKEPSEDQLTFLWSLYVWNKFKNSHDKQYYLKAFDQLITSRTVQSFNQSPLYKFLSSHGGNIKSDRNDRFMLYQKLGLMLSSRKQAVDNPGGLGRLILAQTLQRNSYFLNDVEAAKSIDSLINVIHSKIDHYLLRPDCIYEVIQLIANAYIAFDDKNQIENKEEIQGLIKHIFIENGNGLLGRFEDALGQREKIYRAYFNCFICCIFFNKCYASGKWQIADLCYHVLDSTTFTQLPKDMKKIVEYFMKKSSKHSFHGRFVGKFLQVHKSRWMQFVRKHPSILYGAHFGAGLLQGFGMNRLLNMNQGWQTGLAQDTRMKLSVRALGILGSFSNYIISEAIIPEWLIKQSEKPAGRHTFACSFGGYLIGVCGRELWNFCTTIKSTIS